MAKPKNPYQNFNTYCLRAPVLPLTTYTELTAGLTVSEAAILNLCSTPIIKEALFLASPELNNALKKLVAGTLDSSKKEKLCLTVLKYFSRMASRCTPFGLFAGCSAGVFGMGTRITPRSVTAHDRITRFDMHYLVNLGRQITENKEIRQQLQWYPNNSLYAAGMHYRYVEYTYRDKKRQHSIEAVSRSEYLEHVLGLAKTGKTIPALAKSLVNEDISLSEATDFVEELIANQLLVSELDPTITGEDYLATLALSLEQLAAPEGLRSGIHQKLRLLHTLDQKLGNPLDVYLEFQQGIASEKTMHEPKYLFQTDVFLGMHANSLDEKWGMSLKKGITFLNKITLPATNSTLEQFKKAFQLRYEDREVALATALDIEMGLGYVQGQETSGIDGVLDDLRLPVPPKTDRYQRSWSSILDILQHKLMKTLQKRQYVMVLTDTDFEDHKARWDDLPNTMATMVELVVVAGKQYVVMESMGGSSAGNLLGRFCYGAPKLQDLVTQITQKEAELASEDVVHAEIVHLPESRTGNILRRPTLRPYEIPYLGASQLPIEQQLPIEDLTLSMQGGQLLLRSKRLKKQVIPHLTNAHNYSANALPIYHLLCDLQLQASRGGVGFSWGALSELHPFLPRVVYNDLILAKARWQFTKEAWTPFQKVITHPEELIKMIRDWSTKHQMPQYLHWVEGDNTLLVNLENATTFQMLFHSIKNKPKVILEEFLFAESQVVQGEHAQQKKNGFTNQLVVAFYKEKLTKNRETNG